MNEPLGVEPGRQARRAEISAVHASSASETSQFRLDLPELTLLGVMSVVLLGKLRREGPEGSDEAGGRDSVSRAVHAVEEILHREGQPSLGASNGGGGLERRLELGNGLEGLESRVEITRVAEVDKTGRASGRHGKFRLVHVLDENNLLLRRFRQRSSVANDLTLEELAKRSMSSR